MGVLAGLVKRRNWHTSHIRLPTSLDAFTNRSENRYETPPTMR